MTAEPDELRRARRAFEAARKRMCAAESVEELEDELSNMLGQMYRLSEHKASTFPNDSAYYDALKAAVPAANASIWARSFDTHQLVVVAEPGDVFSDFMTNMFGVLVWRSLSHLPKTTRRGAKASPHREDVCSRRTWKVDRCWTH